MSYASDPTMARVRAAIVQATMSAPYSFDAVAALLIQNAAEVCHASSALGRSVFEVLAEVRRECDALRGERDRLAATLELRNAQLIALRRSSDLREAEASEVARAAQELVDKLGGEP